MDVDTKEFKQLGDRGVDNLDRLVWLPDDSGVVFTSPVNTMSFNSQIWEVTYPDGEARRMTNDLNYYSGASITADGNTLATVQWSVHSSLWVQRGRAAFSRRPSKSLRVLSAPMGELDSCGPRRMKFCTRIIRGAITPHPRRRMASDARDLSAGGYVDAVAFGMRRWETICVLVTGQRRLGAIFRADLDGSDAKAISPGPIDMLPACSPDGSFVVYWRRMARRLR